MNMLAVGIAAMHAQKALGIPIIGRLGFIVERAGGSLGRSGPFGAGHPGVGEVTAEAALGMDPIRPATKLAKLARSVPVIGHEGFCGESATARWAWHADEVATAAEATLHVLAIAIATELAQLAGRVPIKTNVDRFVVELTAGTNAGHWSTRYGRGHPRGCCDRFCGRGQCQGRRWTAARAPLPIAETTCATTICALSRKLTRPATERCCDGLCRCGQCQGRRWTSAPSDRAPFSIAEAACATAICAPGRNLAWAATERCCLRPYCCGRRQGLRGAAARAPVSIAEAAGATR